MQVTIFIENQYAFMMNIKRFNLISFVCLVVFTLSADFLQAQNPAVNDSLLNSATQLFDQYKEREALQTYQKILQRDSLHFEALWHTSLLYARIGFRISDSEQQKDYYHKAMKFAERTLNTYPDSGMSHFVYAVANGRISDISDTNKRIRLSHVIKKHTQKATEMMPDYAPAWLLFGVWHSEVANVSRAQELAASVVSEGIPEGASNEKAVEYIKKAIELNPDNKIRYKLDLARHYKRTGENDKANKELQETLELEPQNDIDRWNLERAREILSEL